MSTLINIRVHGLSILRNIFIIDGGASYNVGDPVIITGGEATQDAQAVVSEVFSGFINQIRILAGGAGFKTGSNVYVIGAGSASLTWLLMLLIFLAKTLLNFLLLIPIELLIMEALQLMLLIMDLMLQLLLKMLIQKLLMH
jgi:hypothetical protein